MHDSGLSTIAQLLFADEKSLDFARIVSELDAVLIRLRGPDIRIAWDCDDLVTFDMPDCRILLAWAEVGVRRPGGCLTVSVGPSPMDQAAPSRIEHDVLCSRLVERILMRFEPSAVLWCQVPGAVDSEVVDDLADTMPEISAPLPPVDSILDSLTKTDLQIATRNSEARRIRSLAPLPRATTPQTVAPPQPAKAAQPDKPQAVANDRPHLPKPRNAELARIRTALYPPETADAPAYSTQMRLAAHCMNATLIVVWAPLGAAVMTYALLRGENMQMSGRLMAVAGTFFAIAHSPVGDTMVAMARSIG